MTSEGHCRLRPDHHCQVPHVIAGSDWIIIARSLTSLPAPTGSSLPDPSRHCRLRPAISLNKNILQNRWERWCCGCWLGGVAVGRILRISAVKRQQSSARRAHRASSPQRLNCNRWRRYIPAVVLSDAEFSRRTLSRFQHEDAPSWQSA